jgi:hypothetical protein
MNNYGGDFPFVKAAGAFKQPTPTNYRTTPDNTAPDCRCTAIEKRDVQKSEPNKTRNFMEL